jgi:hypothetical protein
MHWSFQYYYVSTELKSGHQLWSTGNPEFYIPGQGRLAQLNKIMGEYKLAVLDVSEVRWNGNRTETTNENIFVYSGMPNIDDDHIR